MRGGSSSPGASWAAIYYQLQTKAQRWGDLAGLSPWDVLALILCDRQPPSLSTIRLEGKLIARTFADEPEIRREQFTIVLDRPDLTARQFTAI